MISDQSLAWGENYLFLTKIEHWELGIGNW